MIYTLPGMGANSNMYLGPWLEVPDMIFLNWPKYNGEKTLPEIAVRIVSENNISQSDSVAGSSLGGMVALEIAKKLELSQVYLFGSAVAKTEINKLLRSLSPLADITPIKLIQVIAGKYQNEVMSMFSTSEADFITAMCHAVVNWEGFKGDMNSIKRIHGKKDKVITCPDNCETIKTGGHLIAITHAHECINILSD